MKLLIQKDKLNTDDPSSNPNTSPRSNEAITIDLSSCQFVFFWTILAFLVSWLFL